MKQQRWKRCVIIAFVILFCINFLYSSHLTGENTALENEIDLLNKRLHDTTYALSVTRYDQVRWFELREKVEATRSQGFSPDSLVIWTIVDIRDQFPSVGHLVDSVAAYESSWGYNKQQGLIGEKGWAQIRPETLCYTLYGLGGDTVDMHKYYYDNPLPVRSATEFFYAIATINRFLNDGAFYQNWNRGMLAKIKKRNDYKPKKLGRYSLR